MSRSRNSHYDSQNRVVSYLNDDDLRKLDDYAKAEEISRSEALRQITLASLDRELARIIKHSDKRF